MKIQYCSDLHIEFPENMEFLSNNPIDPVGEILVLAGDIIPLIYIEKFKSFFDRLSSQFDFVYWMPGNHEYYNGEFDNSEEALYHKVRHNVFLINNHAVIHDGVNLIFSTLWSHIRPANAWMIRQSVSDFHVIKCKNRVFTVEEFNKAHQTGLNFIRNALSIGIEKSNIVITHHVPTLLNYPEQYKNSPINEAFAVELYDFIKTGNIDYWIYGHHHTNTANIIIGNTQLLTNQLGYVEHNEYNGYESDAIIIL